MDRFVPFNGWIEREVKKVDFYQNYANVVQTRVHGRKEDRKHTKFSERTKFPCLRKKD